MNGRLTLTLDVKHLTAGKSQMHKFPNEVEKEGRWPWPQTTVGPEAGPITLLPTLRRGSDA